MNLPAKCDINSMPGVKRIVLWSIAVILVLFAGCSVALIIAARRFQPAARKWIVDSMEKRYKSQVEMGSFHASLYPLPKATIEDIVLTRQGSAPLARIKRMTLEASFAGLRAKPVRLSKLTLEGLEVTIQPKRPKVMIESAPSPASGSGPPNPAANFLLEHVVANGMLLRLIPADPAKVPRDFEFKTLSLSSVGIGLPLRFHASLTNWKPPGNIETTGEFGPWDASEPGATPLDGKYTFREADLSVFKGIAGKLSSDGEYHGRLNRIECSGTTDTPDFSISTGRPVHLKTEFHAVVDGTNGDTMLEPVIAHFRQTTVIARGAVVNIREHKGKDISLSIAIDHGRIEDLLYLTVRSSEPLLTGPLTFRSTFALPPGPLHVIDRLRLAGHFNLPSGHFTSLKVRDLLGNFSRRAEGDPGGEADENVASDLSGDFTLNKSAFSFSRLVFGIPGAEIRLTGSYGIHGGEIDFTGQARTVAKLSQMTTGVKSKLLKFVDPFFRKDGAGAVLPIRVTGTKDHPKFGLNFGKPKK